MNTIKNLETLTQLLEASKTRPLLIFKHSATCPISARALRETQAFLDTDQPDVESAIVVIQESLQVSQEISSAFGIEHESPQVIIVINGKPLWDTSHFQITRDNLRTSIQSIQQERNC